MKRFGFALGVIVALVAVLCMAQTYITDTGQNWRLTGTVLENCKFTGSLAINTGGNTYYVDGNMADDNGDGLTWTTAYQKLTTALAASHANIALTVQRGWAWRNVIYVRGDEITENFTKGAQRTDIVGVGSTNQHNKPRIIGTWIIEAQTENDYMGMRFFNVQLQDDGAGGAIFLSPINQCNGLEFHECKFISQVTDTIGIQLGGVHDVVIDNCEFQPNTSGVGFSASAIKIVDGAGALTNVRISNCRIWSASIGIDWDETSNINCWILDNFFNTGGMCIDSEDVTGVLIAGNRMKTALGSADNTSNDFNVIWGVDNIVTGSSDTIYIPSPADF